MAAVVYGHSFDKHLQHFDSLLKMLEAPQVPCTYCSQQAPTHSGVYLGVGMGTSKKLCLSLKRLVIRQQERSRNLHSFDLERASGL